MPLNSIGASARTTTDRVGFLQATDLFAGVSRESLAHLLAGMREQVVGAGATVFRKGDAGDALYIVIDGKLRLESDGVHLVTRCAGECVGEFALVDEGPRSASAMAETTACLLRWDREQFQRTLLETPEVARGIFRILTAKLRQDVTVHVDFALEKERWHQDLQRAREIQMGMLPGGDLSADHYAVSGHCQPAVEVGGDYYDFIALDGGKLGLIIGDVTGHGFYSGLFVAMAKSCLHTLTGMDQAPHRVMHAMRRTLSLSIQRRLLMSCCYVRLDPACGRLCYANAGHPFPYRYCARDARLERLTPLDPILGVLDMAGVAFRQRDMDWEPGDVLVMYTDGVTEQRDRAGRMFDNERLEALITLHAHENAAAIKHAILDAVSGHGAGATQNDDLTLVVARAL